MVNCKEDIVCGNIKLIFVFKGVEDINKILGRLGVSSYFTSFCWAVEADDLFYFWLLLEIVDILLRDWVGDNNLDNLVFSNKGHLLFEGVDRGKSIDFKIFLQCLSGMCVVRGNKVVRDDFSIFELHFGEMLEQEEIVCWLCFALWVTHWYVWIIEGLDLIVSIFYGLWKNLPCFYHF